jgi:PadR family transcriptional regulator, regulatory protein PadR
MADPRMSLMTLLVLRELIAAGPGEKFGLEITRATGIASGTLYPILARLSDAGWLSSRLEDIDPVIAQRPRRRYYRLTPEGAPQAKDNLAYYAQRLTALKQLA